MTTPEPPEGRTPGSSDRPGDDARDRAPRDPAAGTPAEPAPGPSGPARDDSTRDDSTRAAEQPTARLAQPAAGPAAGSAGGPAAGSAAGSAAPPPPAAGRRRWAPRRRWFTAGAAVLVLLLVGAAAFGIARHREGPGHWGDRHGGPDRSAWREDGGQRGMAFDDDGPDGPGGMGGLGPGGMDGFGPGPGMGPRGGDGRHGPDGRRGGMANTAAVTGSVVSVGNGNLVVAVDGGPQTTIPTTGRTRVRGAGNGLTGLQPGQRVVVRVGGDRSAVAVVVPAARAIGTITALEGTRATVVRPDGLTEVVDVAAANPLPRVGDQIAARGAAADNGATLKADTVRILPRAG